MSPTLSELLLESLIEQRRASRTTTACRVTSLPLNRIVSTVILPCTLLRQTNRVLKLSTRWLFPRKAELIPTLKSASPNGPIGTNITDVVRPYIPVALLAVERPVNLFFLPVSLFTVATLPPQWLARLPHILLSSLARCTQQITEALNLVEAILRPSSIVL